MGYHKWVGAPLYLSLVVAVACAAAPLEWPQSANVTYVTQLQWPQHLMHVRDSHYRELRSPHDVTHVNSNGNLTASRYLPDRIFLASWNGSWSAVTPGAADASGCGRRSLFTSHPSCGELRAPADDALLTHVHRCTDTGAQNARWTHVPLEGSTRVFLQLTRDVARGEVIVAPCVPLQCSPASHTRRGDTPINAVHIRAIQPREPAAEGEERSTEQQRRRQHPCEGQWGAFAATALEPFTVLGVYVGHMHVCDNTSHSHHYRVRHSAPEARPALCIDATHVGNEMRFINDFHGIADEPNVRFVQGWIGGELRLLVVTLKDIDAGEELVVDYGAAYWRAEWRARVHCMLHGDCAFDVSITDPVPPAATLSMWMWYVFGLVMAFMMECVAVRSEMDAEQQQQEQEQHQQQCPQQQHPQQLHRRGVNVAVDDDRADADDKEHEAPQWSSEREWHVNEDGDVVDGSGRVLFDKSCVQVLKDEDLVGFEGEPEGQMYVIRKSPKFEVDSDGDDE